ncbi:SPFH domain-containing protein [Microvirga sp. TS319]|uniref:SPFH domain-containing protein n=1 Tax=Microvirga sp. TS319 TaxID=3241165 RepID=UPI00351A475D
MHENWSLDGILIILIGLGFLAFVLSGLRRTSKGLTAGQRRTGIFFTVYEWEHALLYVDGRFLRLLPPGRYFNLGLRQRDIYTLRRHDRFLTTALLDVTTLDKLVFRLAAIVTYEIVDPRQAVEVNDFEAHVRLAVTAALAKLAAEHTLEAFMTERGALDERLLAALSAPVAGCTIKTGTITTVTLPPEIRRLITEVERAKLEGLATLERARGEHAALRSLANAARMLKGNPELMNLRVLQSLSAVHGRRSPTLVLGQGALLPIGNDAETTDE